MCRRDQLTDKWPQSLDGTDLLVRLELLVSVARAGQREGASDLEDVPLEVKLDGVRVDHDGNELVA
jgi:hypothetical protein